MLEILVLMVDYAVVEELEDLALQIQADHLLTLAVEVLELEVVQQVLVVLV
jgi:hypothetical protein